MFGESPRRQQIGHGYEVTVEATYDEETYPAAIDLFTYLPFTVCIQSVLAIERS